MVGGVMAHDVELIFPTEAHEADALAYVAEHVENGEPEIHGDSGLDSASDYGAWLGKIRGALTLPISSIIFFAYRKADGKMIGTINVRYPYEGYVRENGHIGYGVLPSERGRGYATAMLRAALVHCEKIGLDRVLLVCDEDNIASAKTIQKCGGVLERATEGGEQRYWIDTKP